MEIAWLQSLLPFSTIPVLSLFHWMVTSNLSAISLIAIILDVNLLSLGLYWPALNSIYEHII